MAAHPQPALALPVPGLGTWRADLTVLEDAVYAALEAGYIHIDTAGLYNNAPQLRAAISRAVAAGVLKKHDDVFLTSKLAMTEMHPSAVRPAILRALEGLGVPKLNLFLTHWPYALDGSTTPPTKLGYSPEAYAAVWREMEAAVADGLVDHIGCSNMTQPKLAALLKTAVIKPACLQVEMHPFLAQPDLLAFCKEHGITVTTYHPLGSPTRPAQYRSPGDPDVLGDPTVLGVAREAGQSPAAVVLKWAVQRGTCPLPRSVTPARLRENLAACVGDWVLTREQMRALDGLDATVGQKGRIMKGDHLVEAGGDWRAVWD